MTAVATIVAALVVFVAVIAAGNARTLRLQRERNEQIMRERNPR